VITATPIPAQLPDGKLLVRLSEPIRYVVFVSQDPDGELPALQETRTTSYALVSAVELETLDTRMHRTMACETAVFPADEDGTVLDLGVLSCVSGVADPGVAVRAAGWKLMQRTQSA
jgi:hypothetical protein